MSGSSVLNLASILFNSVLEYSHEPALLSDGESVSYGQLESRCRRFATLLRTTGIGVGDRVAIMAPNIPQFTVAYFGILSVGGIVVPLNVLLTGEEVASILTGSGSTGLVLWEGVVEAGLEGFARAEPCRRLFTIGSSRFRAIDGSLDFDASIETSAESLDVEDTKPNDTAVIFYTSGTTGRPKGAEITHFNLYSNARWVSEETIQSSGVKEFWGPGHVVLAALPFSHSFGQTCLQNASLFHGAAISLLPRFSAELAVRKIQEDRITLAAAVPSMIVSLLDYARSHKEVTSMLRYCLVGGAPISEGSVEAFEKEFDVKILVGYGLSETSPVIASCTVGSPGKPGSVGKPISGVKVRIIDDHEMELPRGTPGEIVVLGDPVMKGYFRDPETTSAVIRAGWFHTGDIGYLDAEDHLFIIDRKKDTILRNGYSVYPREVEDVLITHPAVKESAVIGILDAACGEEVVAVVVMSPETMATAEELIAHCKNRLAAYKFPRKIAFQETLPKGTKGQVLKRVLRESLPLNLN